MIDCCNVCEPVKNDCCDPCCDPCCDRHFSRGGLFSGNNIWIIIGAIVIIWLLFSSDDNCCC